MLGTIEANAQFAITEDFRGSGNPDIIIGGPGGTEGTAYLTSGVNDPLNAGWLRLTNATTYQKGFAYVNKSFPSTLGVLVDFEYKMWRATTDGYNGADGIGVFLFDASSAFQLGGYGGSLGYAPNNSPPAVPGLAGGYVGVGLDAYGNYANPNEGKVGGPGERPNAIVLRGITTNLGTTTNQYLTGKTITTTDGVNFNYLDIVANTGDRSQNALDYNTVTTTRPTDSQFYRRVQLEITRLDAAGIYYNVLVRWKTTPTGPFVYVTDYTTTDIPPSLLKLGFAASTGGGINYHEIRNLLVTTPGNLRVVKRGDKDILRLNNATNSTITYTIEVTNDTAFEIPSIAFSDKITDAYDNLIPEGTSGFDITSITTSGFVTAAMPTVSSLTTNEISGNLVLAANTTGYITITGRLYMLPDGGMLKNTASAIPPLDEDLNNNISVVETPVTSEGVDLLLTKTVSEQCISTTVPTFTVYLSNNGAVGQSFKRLGPITGTRVGFSIVVPPGYTYVDTTPGGLAGTETDEQNSNVTARWSRKQFDNIPSAGYTTYYYIARGTDAGGAAQTLGAGLTYPYPVTYTLQAPSGTTMYTDTSTARMFSGLIYGTSTETAANQVNNNASIDMYIKPAAPIVSSSTLFYCVDEDAPELTATKTNSAYTLRWYMTAGGFSSEYPIKPETSVAGNYTYYVSQVNGDCEGPTSSINVFVGPSTTGTINGPSAVCPGSTAAFTGPAVSGSGITNVSYSWQRAAEGGTYTTISGATGQNYTSPALTETTYFRRLVTLTQNGKTCTGPGNAIRVFVANPGIIGNSQASCGNFDPDPFTNVQSGTNGTIGTITYAYQWQISNDGTTGWTDISGATGATYDHGGISGTNGTRYFQRLVKYTANGITCSVASNVVVAFRGNGGAPSPGGIGSDQTICNGDTPAGLTSTGAGGTGYFQWEYSTTSATAGFTIIPEASPTSGTYAPGALTVTTWYRRTKINGCGTPTGVTVKITVLNPTPGTIGTTQTICYNTIPAQLTGSAATLGSQYRWEVAEGTSGGTWSTAPGTSTGQNYTAPLPLTTSKRYRRIVISTSVTPVITCESLPSNIVTIIVKSQINPGTITGAQSVCNGGTASTITGTTASSEDAITYQWRISANGTSGWANASGSSTAQDYTPTVTGYYLRRATTSTCGFAESNIVYVSFQATVNPGTITAPAATTICYNTAPGTITGSAGTGGTGGTYSYRWESSASSTGPFVTAAGTFNLQNYTSLALTATTYFRRVVISTVNGNACESVATTPVMITVQNAVGVGSITGPATACNNSPITITSAPGGTGTGSGTITYRWESAPGATGGTFTIIAGQTAETLSATFTGTTRYQRYTISTQNGVACTAGPTNVVTVTLQGLPSGGVIANTPGRVCSGGTAVFTNGTSGGNFTSYQWQYSTSNSPYNWINISDATSATYTSFPLTAKTWFQRLAVNACGSATSGVIPIDVTTIDPGSLGPDKTICYNTLPGTLGSGTGTVNGSSNAGSVTYTWQSAPGASGGTFTDIGGATNQTSPTYTPPANLTATTRYRRITSNTSNTVTCTASVDLLVTVQSRPVEASIIAPSPSAVCTGSTVTIGSGGPGSGDGSITYRWEAAPASTNVYATVSGATDPTLTVTPTQTTYYRRYTVSTVNTVGCESPATNVVTITIYPTNIDPGVIGTSQNVCTGTIPPTITGQGTTGVGVSADNYFWQYSTDGSTWTDTSVITPDYQFFAPITQTMYFRRFGTKECRGVTASNVVVYTVPTAPSAGTIGSNQNLCYGMQPDLLTSINPGAGTGYQWQESNDGTSNWLNINGATSATYLPPITYTKYYRRMTLYSGSCATPSNVVNVIVNNTYIDPGSISKNQTVCSNQTPDTLNYSNGGSGWAGSTGAYRWDSSTDGTNWTSTGTTTEFYYFSGPLAATTYYRRATIGTTCTGEKYTNPITITVTLAAVGGTAGPNQTICNGATAPTLTVAGASTGTYIWYVSTDNSSWSTTGVTTATYSPGTLTATRYYRRGTTPASCSGEALSTTVTITVQPAIAGGTASSNQNICNGATATTLTVTGADTGTYRWESSTASATGPWGNATGTITGPSYAPGTMTTTTYYRRATISGSCEGYSNTVTITVSDPVMAGSISGTQTICMDTAPAILGSTTVGLGTGSGTITYRWESSVNGTSGWTTISGVTGSTYQPPVLHSTRYYRRITISTSTVTGNTATCESSPTATATVTIKKCKVISNPMVRSRVN